jgi:hypothetical protein
VSADEDRDDRADLLEKVERGVMKKHFDELVPFYELAVRKQSGETLYESICNRILDQIIAATKDDMHYVIIAHSMGCAVSYNVLTHIGCAKSNKKYCPIQGALSEAYRKKVKQFADSGSRCFGLLTFGNYTGYDWCQRLNNRLLFGHKEKQYVYPKAVGRWYNFWTLSGGDPYIIDDQLDDDIVDDNDDRYEDVMVRRLIFSNIGHGRAKWFRRNQFAKKLRRKMAYHLYL